MFSLDSSTIQTSAVFICEYTNQDAAIAFIKGTVQEPQHARINMIFCCIYQDTCPFILGAVPTSTRLQLGHLFTLITSKDTSFEELGKIHTVLKSNHIDILTTMQEHSNMYKAHVTECRQKAQIIAKHLAT